MKKMMFFCLTVLTLLLVACKDKINIDISDSITVYINEPYEIEYKTNDKKGLTFSSANESLFTVSTEGVITPLQKGQTFLNVTSKTDSSVSLFVTVHILEGDYINVVSELALKVGEEETLQITTSLETGVNFQSTDTSIATVSETGKIKAISAGVVSIVITAKENSNLKATVNLTVTLGSTIEVPSKITLKRHALVNLEVTTDIPNGVTYESLNENIVSVNNSGVLKGINQGTTTVKVISKDDTNNYKEVVVTVEQLEDVILEASIEKDEQYQIGDLITNPIYISDDETIATVDEQGLITAVNPGFTVIKVVNENDSNISIEFSVYVITEPESIEIIGSNLMILGESQTLTLAVEPIYGSKEAIYQSLNPSVLSVSLNGIVKAINPGNGGVRVTPLSNPELAQTIYITVKSILLVDSSKQDGDIVEHLGFEFLFGQTLFSSINEAINKSVNNTEIIIFDGVYNESVIVDKKVTLNALGNPSIKGNIVIAASDVTVDGFIIDNGNVTNTVNVENIAILNNKFRNFNNETAIKLDNVSGINVSYNEIALNIDNGIIITGIKKGNNYINGNTIKGVNVALKVTSNEDYNLETVIDIMWNKINDIETAFLIDLGEGDNVGEIRQVLRFNEVSRYQIALSTREAHNLDLNLNYWGESFDIDKFVNVNNSELAGFYTNKEEIIPQEDYDPRVPVKIEIVNKTDEIEVGEEYTIEYVIYPKELGDNTVRWNYSNLPALEVNGSTIKGIISWDVVISLIARDNSNIRDSFTLSITTDPYLDFVPVNKTYSDFYVGNSFKIDVNVAPYQIRNEEVIFASSDPLVASVTEGGIVSLLSPGAVTINVYLKIDESVNQEFKFVVFDELRIDDPFGFAISTMVNYTTFRSWNVYGVNFDYQAEYLDSVSRILIEDIVIDESLMLPDEEEYEDFRPGYKRPKPSLPEEQIYNDEHVQYVVVHETANTNEGGGARWHAEYLFNIPERVASWHFTVDDKEIYQHIPTDEVAWHAGDGSTLAGSPWSDGNTGGIGGGNRNGIGIETSVALGDDIMSVWHRTARLAAVLSKEYNLPANQHRGNVKFHQDFSGKVCPQSMIRGGLTDFFYGLVEQEYIREYNFPGLSLTINSHNEEYLSNNGRVIKRPVEAITVSYDLTITYEGETRVETLYVYIPGQIK